MTAERETIVAAVVAAAGGTLISRVRMQKSVYLLDRLGLNSGFEFEYHHYGPYSRDLDLATADAVALQMVSETFQHREGDGARYSVFNLRKDRPADDAFGQLGPKRASALAEKFASANITVLELAATVDWLCHAEKCEDWRAEVSRRKPLKVGGGRLDRAVTLLTDLGLPPPS
jgi:uncharacterized protein YwgA